MRIGTILRLAAIGAGIFSTAQIMRVGLQIPLSDFLNNVIAAYDSALTILSLLVEPVSRAAFESLNSLFGVELSLYPHWKHVFILTWLFVASQVRANFLPSFGRFGRDKFEFLWGLLCALLAGICAGTAPISHPAVFLWSIFWLIVHRIGNTIWIATFMKIMIHRAGNSFSWISLVAKQTFVMLKKYVVVGFVAASISVAVFPATFSWLAALLLFVAMEAGLYLKYGLSRTVGEGMGDLAPGETRFDHPATRVGLEILSVLGVASLVVWIGSISP